MIPPIEPPSGPTTPSLRRARWKRAFVIGLLFIVVVVSSLVTAANWKQPHHRAVLGMAWGLIVFWIIGSGLAQWRKRALWVRLAAKARIPWMVKFVAGCILLAMLEEAVTTGMTNCAPLFGVKIGEAYYPDSGMDDTLGGPFDRQRCCSLGQRPLRASFLAAALLTAKIFRQFLSSIPLSG